MRHAYVETIAQDPTDDRIQGDEWNADHIFIARAEPADAEVAEGTAFPWMSSVDGSIMVKIKFGGVVKTATLIPFPILS